MSEKVFNKLIFIFLLIVFLDSNAQSIEKTILVRDELSQQPIEDAVIIILKTKQTILTNKEGKGTFLLRGNSNIQISHTAFNTISFKSSILINSETVVLLKNNLNDLDDVIIINQPQRLLKNLVENSKRNLTMPARLKVFSQEFYKLNGKDAYYNDGLLNFQLFVKTKKFSCNILVEQNRSIGLIDENISSDLLGYNLNNIMENYYNFKYLNPLLASNAFKNYDFILKVHTKNKLLNEFTVIPNDNTNNLFDEFNIIYEPKRNLIVAVSTTLNPTKKFAQKLKTTIGNKYIYKSNFEALYQVDNFNYYLLHSKEEIGFEKNEKDAVKNIEVKHYFVTNHFDTKHFSHRKENLFEDKSLLNLKNQIFTDYWKTSGKTATADEELILKSIENQK